MQGGLLEKVRWLPVTQTVGSNGNRWKKGGAWLGMGGEGKRALKIFLFFLFVLVYYPFWNSFWSLA